MRTIAFFSLKGGCGKTMSCVNIAAALAERGKRVLIIDLDANACASRTFGVIANFDDSIGAALLAHTPLKSVIRPTDVDGVWLAPASAELRVIDVRQDIHDPERVNPDGSLNDIALSWELYDLGKGFDYVLVDCPGGDTFMHRLALIASDEVILPTGLSAYDLHATTPSLQLILLARKARDAGGRPRFLGFLPNGASRRRVPAAMRRTLDEYHASCFSPVRHSGLLKTMPGRPSVRQRLLVLARPEHPAAVRYREIAREIELGIEAARQLAAELARPPDSLTPPSLLAIRKR